MYEEFKDKVVLVTGGNSGIGKATALAFARSGAKVTITGQNTEKGIEVVKEAQEEGFILEFVSSDVADPKQVQELIQGIVQRYGRLDIAFNNAGVGGNRGRIEDCSIESWQNTINVNLNGTFYCLKYELIEMLKTGGGTIVNNISVSGHRGYPGGAAYVSSKHGLTGLTKAAAMEYAGKNIRVNGVSPGLILTPMLEKERERKPDYDEWVKKVEPIGRMGTPEEVAHSVLWLCSEKAAFVTGHILAVDGGILAC